MYTIGKFIIPISSFWLDYCGISTKSTMKGFNLLAVFLLFFVSTMYGSTPEDVANAIKTGNAGQISKHFSDNIDLKILDKEEVYSKSQAELIIKDFLAKHVVKSFTITHKSSAKNDSEYAIGSLETSSGKYRVYYLMKKTANKLLVNQFKIEIENE